MMNQFEQCLAFVLKHEGGFVFNKRDPGGMTNLGVTKKAWEAYVGHEVSEKDMRALTPDIVAPFYRSQYWKLVRADDLPIGVDLCVFDCAVNSGVDRASRFLQRCVGAQDDGSIGPATLSAVAKKGVIVLIDQYCTMREDYLHTLPIFDTFGRGWMQRVQDVRDKARAMLFNHS